MKNWKIRFVNFKFDFDKLPLNFKILKEKIDNFKETWTS